MDWELPLDVLVLILPNLVYHLHKRIPTQLLLYTCQIQYVHYSSAKVADLFELYLYIRSCVVV